MLTPNFHVKIPEGFMPIFNASDLSH
ncbi:hypothetical protein BIW11_02811 [Tropilaelaps mercedesae]|uniref:Uncharacterized protein n=1 Tax=Tropilaelaps mercedesae TaxID=418985 RepID=A0A1V9XWX5_9ACAR|nr:hypothetical protein BIW11_02811 [Tropilaelaps mercedesae]